MDRMDMQYIREHQERERETEVRKSSASSWFRSSKAHYFAGFRVQRSSSKKSMGNGLSVGFGRRL